MEKTNSKILTLSFATLALIIGFTLSLLLKAFAGAFGIVARATDSDLVRHGLPVLTGLALFAYLQFSPKVLTWADEVVTEVRKVVFPSRKDTTGMTMVVILFVIVSTIIVTFFDFFSSYFINAIIK
jgi:preprotein translocase subunit SecE